MCEISFRWVNSLKLRVRCFRAVSREISGSLFRLLPWRFSTCMTGNKSIKLLYCQDPLLVIEKSLMIDVTNWTTHSTNTWVLCVLGIVNLTVIWLRMFALATVSMDFSSRLSILGFGFRMGCIFNASSSRSSSARGTGGESPEDLSELDWEPSEGLVVS